MEIVAWFIIINWGTTLLFWLYPLTMWLIFKDFKFEGFYGPFAKFRLINKGEIDDPIEPWHALAWIDWWGICLHWFICYRDRPGKWDDKQVERGLIHECTHGYQQMLGLLWWVIYFGHMNWIFWTQRLRYWVFTDAYTSATLKQAYTKHPYLDCVWERMARKRAGQQVDIPPEQWTHGPRDLWPWW